MSPPDQPRIELARRVQRDARGLDKPIRERLLAALEQLVSDAENLDVKALSGDSSLAAAARRRLPRHLPTVDC